MPLLPVWRQKARLQVWAWGLGCGFYDGGLGHGLGVTICLSLSNRKGCKIESSAKQLRRKNPPFLEKLAVAGNAELCEGYLGSSGRIGEQIKVLDLDPTILTSFYDRGFGILGCRHG